MPSEPTTNLVNMGDLTKPADTLITKISNAVGGLFAPYQIKRLARAEAEAALIRERSTVEVTDLHRRAVHRRIEEEAQRQENMEDITAKAIPQLGEAVDASVVHDDWIVNFFDKSPIVSDKQMQDLWASILAGEVNTPGTYSKRTVNFLSDLDKGDAELITILCRFTWTIGMFVPLVFDDKASIYSVHGINFGSLHHLDSIGLISFDALAGFKRTEIGKRYAVYYYGRELLLEMPKDEDNELPIGNVVLTKIGRELAPICQGVPVEGFWGYVGMQWKTYLQKSEPE